MFLGSFRKERFMSSMSHMSICGLAGCFLAVAVGRMSRGHRRHAEWPTCQLGLCVYCTLTEAFVLSLCACRSLAQSNRSRCYESRRHWDVKSLSRPSPAVARHAASQPFLIMQSFFLAVISRCFSFHFPLFYCCLLHFSWLDWTRIWYVW